MPLGAIRVSSPLPASAARVYAAWLDTLEHSNMTGGAATVDAKIGGHHTAWDGYIEGEILELEPGQRILQSWRSNEFPEGHAPSILEIRLRDTATGCEIWISHSEIPEGQAEKYETGWHERYFIPMTKYFRESAEARETPRTDPSELAPVPVETPPRGRDAESAKAAKPKKAAKPEKAAKSEKAAKPKKTKGAPKAARPAKAKKAARPAKAKSGAEPARKAAKPAKAKAPKKGAKKATPRKAAKAKRAKGPKVKPTAAKRKPAARRSARS